MQPAHKYLTLKNCLLGLAVLVYLTGIFREGIFEVTHVLVHQFKGEYSYHSHHTHVDGADHEHELLDMAKAAFEAPEDAPVSQENRPKLALDKNLPVCLPIALQRPLDTLKKKTVFLFDFQLPVAPFLQLSTPPPDFHASSQLDFRH